jgi:hypothetical protein
MPSCDALATRTADEEHLGVEQRRGAAQRVEPVGGIGTRAQRIRRACRRNDVRSVTTADAPQRPTSGMSAHLILASSRSRTAGRYLRASDLAGPRRHILWGVPPMPSHYSSARVCPWS